MLHDTAIATVGDLRAALDGYDPDTPVRLATQRGYPLEFTLGCVACTPQDAEGDGTEPTDPSMVWIGEGRQVGYLPATATDALDW